MSQYDTWCLIDFSRNCHPNQNLQVPKNQRIMDDFDMFENHQCFRPYLDVPLCHRNYRKSDLIINRPPAFTPSSAKKTASLTSLSRGDSLDSQRYSLCRRKDSVQTFKSIKGKEVGKQRTSSRFLDWLSECFWKCSTGCQELPTAK